jgi:hypothetical protein
MFKKIIDLFKKEKKMSNKSKKSLTTTAAKLTIALVDTGILVEALPTLAAKDPIVESFAQGRIATVQSNLENLLEIAFKEHTPLVNTPAGVELIAESYPRIPEGISNISNVTLVGAIRNTLAYGIFGGEKVIEKEKGDDNSEVYLAFAFAIDPDLAEEYMMGFAEVEGESESE